MNESNGERGEMPLWAQQKCGELDQTMEVTKRTLLEETNRQLAVLHAQKAAIKKAIDDETEQNRLIDELVEVRSQQEQLRQKEATLVRKLNGLQGHSKVQGHAGQGLGPIPGGPTPIIPGGLVIPGPLGPPVAMAPQPPLETGGIPMEMAQPLRVNVASQETTATMAATPQHHKRQRQDTTATRKAQLQQGGGLSNVPTPMQVLSISTPTTATTTATTTRNRNIQRSPILGVDTFYRKDMGDELDPFVVHTMYDSDSDTSVASDDGHGTSHDDNDNDISTSIRSSSSSEGTDPEDSDDEGKTSTNAKSGIAQVSFLKIRRRPRQKFVVRKGQYVDAGEKWAMKKKTKTALSTSATTQ